MNLKKIWPVCHKTVVIVIRPRLKLPTYFTCYYHCLSLKSSLLDVVHLLYRVSKDCLQRLPDSHSRPHQHQLQLLLLASPCHLHSLIPPQFSLSGFGLSEAVPEVISWPRRKKIGRLNRYFLIGLNKSLKTSPYVRESKIVLDS